MKKILTTLTLLITLCSFAFGQDDYYYFGNDVYGPDYNMTMASIIYVDGVLQTDQTIEIAAFIDGNLRGYCKTASNYPHFPEPYNGYYYKEMIILGYTYDEGKEIVFKAYNHDTGVELSLLDESDDLVYEVNAADHGVKNPLKLYFATPIQSVAKINETEEYFNTLADAVEAAEDDQTITLLQSTQGSGIVIDKDVTINFGGFAYTFNGNPVGSTGTESNGFQILKDNNVTLTDGTLDVAAEAADKFYILIQNYANLTVENMLLDGTNLDKYSTTDGDSYTLSNNSGNVNVTGSTTIIANSDGNLAFALDACKYANYPAPTVTIGEDVTIQGKVEVTGGQLYTDAALDAVVRKTIEVSTSWSTLSAPTQERKAVFSTTGTHDFYQYVESAELEWDYIGDMVEANSYTMEAGRGYLYANKAETIVTFEGALNNETVTHELSYTPAQNLAGFNFIGNPFTHDISFAHLYGNIGDGYYVVGANNEFIAVEPTTSAEAVIAPFQAVLVQATEDAGALAINKKAVAEATREVSNGVLEIVVANANYSDVAYVSFNEGAGLEKIGHNNANVPMVYLPVEDKNYAIAKYNEDVNEIPVSFQAMTMGEYTIGVKSHDCAFESMYLTDRMTGESVNILMEDYTFVATGNDNVERFMLTFATTGVEEAKEESYIFINNDNMIINNVAGNAIVRIVDMMGRVVSEYNVRESASISTSSLNSGVYVIQMSDDNGVKVQKVVIE